jgi:hypothetical protein
MDLKISMERILNLLQLHAFQYANEVQLHESIAELFTLQEIAFEREVQDGANRFDFLIPPGLVVEVKVDGSLSEANRQIARYCECAEVQAVILATTKRWGPEPLIRQIFKGKPVAAVRIRGRAF